MLKILVVEDDRDLNKSICSYLNRIGYNTRSVLNADLAFEALYNSKFDLIISDIMMPGTDGIELAKIIRRFDSEIPILFVTARDDFATKRKSYQTGIDDYMIKPIDLEELVLRIEALLRRAKIASSKELTVGSLTMSSTERSTKINGKEIHLTAREFNILYKLLSYPQKTFTRSQLIEEFWDADTSSGPRTVDVYMAKLREKFSECEDFEIKTVHGLGYKAVFK